MQTDISEKGIEKTIKIIKSYGKDKEDWKEKLSEILNIKFEKVSEV